MNREEVRKAAEVMLAFADGKEIQCSHKGQNNWINWINESSPSFDWKTFDYRIKPKSTYRPFKTNGECWREMYKHPNFGWLLDSDNYLHIANIEDGAIHTIKHPNGISYEDAFKTLTFTDGTPFGIKE